MPLSPEDRSPNAITLETGGLPNQLGSSTPDPSVPGSVPGSRAPASDRPPVNGPWPRLETTVRQDPRRDQHPLTDSVHATPRPDPLGSRHLQDQHARPLAGMPLRLQDRVVRYLVPRVARPQDAWNTKLRLHLGKMV